MLFTQIANYHRLNYWGQAKRKKSRNVDKEQFEKGLIQNKIPVKRDGACLQFVYDTAGDDQDSNVNSDFKDQAVKPEAITKSAVLLIGGDTYMRALNDTYIIKMENE